LGRFLPLAAGAFLPAPALELLEGEGFILQMHRVFTRIRSGAVLVASSGGER
jgi:hypothetical protein